MPLRSSLPDRLVQAIDGFGIERKPSGGHLQNTAIETGLDKLHGSLGEIRKPGQHALAQAHFSAPQNPPPLPRYRRFRGSGLHAT